MGLYPTHIGRLTKVIVGLLGQFLDYVIDVSDLVERSVNVGYGRTSTADQTAGLSAQRRDLEAVGCSRLFTEQVSSVATRDQLSAAMEFVREGDALVVTKLDRLARSTVHLLAIVEELDRKGVALRILDFGGSSVDTKSPSGRLMLTMFAAMGQFEREVMLDRQREGIAAAKAAGKYKGRAPTAKAQSATVLALKAQGTGASEIAQLVGIGRASVYRIIAEAHRQASGATA